NGNIDWNKVKNSGVNYVIIRCGYRGSSEGALIEDPKFKSNIKGATAAGLKVGVYFFTQAVNEVEAVEEASMYINLLRGYSLSFPVYIDVEGSNGRGDSISASQRTANIKAFCGTIQNAGYTAGVYANSTWFTSKINTAQITGYKIWLAQYAASVTYNASRYDMWQYTSKGSIQGITGKVDMNILYR
ncbi:MAG: glycoside hydrolase family 25 protein, partial [Butyrivibrio sp.]|nr:glycoside hydrolase family 25 protein [Butyrivibrio sp.]